MFSVPPSRLAASFTASSGTCRPSRWRRTEWLVHSVEWARSVSDSVLTVERTDLPSELADLGQPARLEHQAGELAAEVGRHLQPVAERLPGEVDLGRPRLGRGGGQLLVGQRRRLGGVALHVEELHRDLQAVLPVGHRVVHLLDEGTPAALDAVDDVELPQRPGAVERIGEHRRGEVEQLAQRARRGQGDVADVVVEVDVVGVDPHRRQAVGALLDALAQPRDEGDGPGEPATEACEVGRPVEQRDVGEGRAKADPSRGATSGPRRRSCAARRRRGLPTCPAG